MRGNKPEVFDIAIIGAGVSGAAIARKLSAFKLAVVVLEKNADISFGVSKANSGIIHAGFHHKPVSLKARLELQGNRMYDRLQQELNFPFKRVGIVVAAFSSEEMKTVESLYRQGITNGVEGLEICSHARILKLEPGLNSDVVGGLFAPSGGIVEPYRFVFALMESARKNGVTLYTDFKVCDAARTGDFPGYLIRAADERKISARLVINAAGLFADEVSRIFGAEDFKIIPRKGEEYLLEKNAAGFPNHVIFPVPSLNSKGVLVIPTVEGTMMIGPTAVEQEDKEDHATTSRNLDKIFSLAMRMVPAISKKEIITAFAGLRPTLAGNDFFIQPSGRIPDFIQVAGIQSPGLTAAPAIAEYVAALLVEQNIRLEASETYDPAVPKHRTVRDADEQTAAALVAENPAFGNIVCRCEQVSEAEIVEAIRAGHTTLDGIKFYARPGMGRCQGAFCTYKILKILARETGKEIPELTKRGGKSQLIPGTLQDARVD